MMEQKKLVALTFDDGPTAGITDKVLDGGKLFPDRKLCHRQYGTAC